MESNILPWYIQDISIDCLGKSVCDQKTITHISNLLTNGYCIIPKSITDEVVQKCVFDYNRFKEVAVNYVTPSEAGKFRRIVNAHCAIPSLADLFCTNSEALNVLDLLFGEPATLYTSLFFEIGSAQDLHRDTPYFWTNPPYKYFGVWVALDQVDEENGCLEVLPGSHLIDEEDRGAIAKIFYNDLNDVPSSDIKLWDYYQELVLSKGLEIGLKKISVCVNPGDTVIWHPQTMHGGRRINNFNRTRLSQAMHVTPKNISVFHNQAFFNPSYPMDSFSSWNYSKRSGREYIQHNTISFEHRYDFNIENQGVFKSISHL